MPANRPKLYKNKNPTKPAKNPQPSTSQMNTSTELPNQEQFEIELCWCIQQLQTALGSGKLNNKQVQDHTKTLNVLMSSTAPVVKKRQVMRMTFGDYREKMSAEEKRISKNAANMRFKIATPNKKTVFLKKSLFSSSVDNNFKFNFNLQDDMDEVNTETSSCEKNPGTVSSSASNFVPSNNTFRFNFKMENEVDSV